MAAQGYIGRAPGESSVIVARQTFTPTGITTNFTFASGYTVGYVDAYLNGARLIEGDDYTATDGSVVGLTTHAINGDVLELVVYKAFNATNVQAAKDDFSVGGDLSVTGTTTLSGNTTVGAGITLDTNGNVNVSGVLTANSFVGDGTQLTGVGGGSVISGITIREEGSVVGTSGTVVNVNFVGPDVTATAQAGFSTITIAAGGKFINFTDSGSTGITTTAKTKIDDDFKVTGVSTFSGNVGINTDIAHHLLTIENAAGAGVANTAILLRNPTTANDSRIGIDFAINANAYGGSVWDGASIYVANGGVAGVGSIMTATVESGISSTRTYISHEGKIFADRETWGSNPTSGNHPGLDINTRTVTLNGDSTYATGIDFRVDNVHAKRLAVTKGDGTLGDGDWIFYRDNGTSEALRITAAGITTVTGSFAIPSVPEANTDNAELPVLFQTQAGTVDGGSGLSYNPAGDVLSVNGLILSSQIVRTSGSNTLTLTTANGNGQSDVRVTTSSVQLFGGSSEKLAVTVGGVNITGITTATQFDATSDVALKENIEVIDEPITKISELKGVTFDWKAGGHSVGVIAQDVEKVLPTAVGGSKDQKTVNYNAIIGLLVESVKDQQKQIEELKSLLDK